MSLKQKVEEEINRRNGIINIIDSIYFHKLNIKSKEQIEKENKKLKRLQKKLKSFNFEQEFIKYLNKQLNK